MSIENEPHIGDPKYSTGNYYHATNRINIPPRMFVSREYNLGVAEIFIDGVFEYHSRLFKAVSDADSVSDAAGLFEEYMSILFELNERTSKGRKVGSYAGLLKSWLFDSNNRAGAVLKGWVENRFGLVPLFHSEPIKGLDTKEYYDYLQEKMSTKTNRNNMYSQLDLLYTYIQTIIKSFFKDHMPLKTLYRGVNSLEEHLIIEQKGKREYCIEQNSLTSFTSEKDIAEQFGAYILKAEIPYTKIVYFSDALPTRSFAGEMEYLVIGGRYDTEVVL